MQPHNAQKINTHTHKHIHCVCIWNVIFSPFYCYNIFKIEVSYCTVNNAYMYKHFNILNLYITLSRERVRRWPNNDWNHLFEVAYKLKRRWQMQNVKFQGFTISVQTYLTYTHTQTNIHKIAHRKKTVAILCHKISTFLFCVWLNCLPKFAINKPNQQQQIKFSKVKLATQFLYHCIQSFFRLKSSNYFAFIRILSTD